MCLSNQANNRSCMAMVTSLRVEYIETQVSWLNHWIAPRNA